MVRCGDATALYSFMKSSVAAWNVPRVATDPYSPMQERTYEAEPGSSFQLMHPYKNVVVCRPVDLRWAAANTLHFFGGSEQAASLSLYNRHAQRFAPDGVWDGAYGAIAVPQLRQCVDLLLRWPQTRRAVVSMGGPELQTINRPACWSFLHFLLGAGGLDLLVYQRSLHLERVMPYDCVLLTNILLYVAGRTALPLGSLRWTVGSLHSGGVEPEGELPQRHSLVLPISLLADPRRCLDVLERPQHLGEVLNGLE
jgi:hypothetical protein